ncbi:hypothetical protein SCLCIDRAFT_32242 [Scleroderma citrinum Foug A]|uniref:CCHC-type domain-containing protein n=1 Tax=Scleroderma citrinum Foug A TaxID=1036808 RepID=A0A0C2ZJS1_9AGAM|nr:hypothetical protein SCLCIDRAFT_32242 [Scleroderma citrinum Foug A]
MQEIDAHYWEHKDEIQRAGKSQTTMTTKPSNSGGTSTSKTGNEKPKSSNSATSSPSKTSFSGSLKPDLNGKLEKDSKLMAAERKRRLDNNLCMFCGGTRHFTDKCPKKTSKAKARTMATESRKSDSNSGASPESKKDAPEEARLNVSALSDPNSLMPYVSFLSYNIPQLHALMDSGSTHCFIDSKYALEKSFTIYSVEATLDNLGC